MGHDIFQIDEIVFSRDTTLLTTVVSASAQVVSSPERTRGTVSNPVASSQHDLVTLTGPGCFISALFHKTGGGAGTETSVELLIDDKTVVGTTFNETRMLGLGSPADEGPSFYGVSMKVTGTSGTSGTSGGVVTVGFPVPLKFDDSLVLRMQLAANDTAVTRIVGQVISGTCPESGSKGGPKK